MQKLAPSITSTLHWLPHKPMHQLEETILSHGFTITSSFGDLRQVLRSRSIVPCGLPTVLLYALNFHGFNIRGTWWTANIAKIQPPRKFPATRYLFPAVTSTAVKTRGSQVKISMRGPYTPLSCFSSTTFLTASIPRLVACGRAKQLRPQN